MLICSKEAANVALNEYWNTIDPNGSNVGQNVMPGGLRVYNSGQIEAMQRAVEAALRLIDDAGEPVAGPATITPDTHAEVVATLREMAGHMISGAPLQPSLRLAGRALGLLGSPVTPGAPISVPRTTPGQDRASGVLDDPDQRGTQPTSARIDGLVDVVLQGQQRAERGLAAVELRVADVVGVITAAEGRLADRVADLARLVVDLKTIPAPVLEVPTVELDWAAQEPTEADLWEAALNMAAAQRDRKSLNGARVLREALWFLRQLQDGPPADDEIDDDPEPAAEDTGPPFARPHLFSAVKSSGGLCDVPGCSRPLMDDVHKLPGNGYAGPNPITAPAG